MSVDVETNKFRPLELNERNVKATFKKCLANEDNIKEGVYYSQVLDLRGEMYYGYYIIFRHILDCIRCNWVVWFSSYSFQV